MQICSENICKHSKMSNKFLNIYRSYLEGKEVGFTVSLYLERHLHFQGREDNVGKTVYSIGTINWKQMKELWNR